VHPTSATGREAPIPKQSNLYVFSEQVATQRTTLCELTQVTPPTLLFFGGMPVHDPQNGSLMLSEWLVFHLEEQDLALLYNLRKQLDWFLNASLVSPRGYITHWASSPHMSFLLKSILDVISGASK